jgi:acetyl esterase/lipase
MVPARHGYGRQDGIDLTLDLYSPDAGGIPDRPLVLVVHGGSWQSGDSRELTGLNRYLAGAGYAVAALNYRLAPRHRFPAPLEDIASAIRFLEGPGRGSGRWKGVVLLGRSSGGHLALLAAYAPVHPAIRGVLALYPPTDLIWSWQRPSPNRLMDSNGVIRAFLGGSPEEMPRRFEAASPVLQVRAGLPPTLLLHGGRDELVSPIQSRRLARALEGAGAPYVHLELPWGKHGMDANLAGPGGQITLYAVTRFLERLGDGDE